MFFNLLKKILLLIKIPFVLTNNKFKKNLFLFLLFISSFVGFDCSALCESISESQSEIISPLEVEENIDYKKYFIYAVGGIALLVFLYYLNNNFGSSNAIQAVEQNFFQNVNVIKTISGEFLTHNPGIVYFQIDKVSKTIHYCNVNFDEFSILATTVPYVAVLDCIPAVDLDRSQTMYNVISGIDMLALIKEYGLTWKKS